MRTKIMGGLCLLMIGLIVSSVSAQDGEVIIPPDPDLHLYDWSVTSSGVFSPPIIESTSSGEVTNSPDTGLEGGTAWGQASINSIGLYVEGKSRTGITSNIYLYYNICAAVEWLKRDGVQIASNPSLNCIYTTGAAEVARTASDAYEPLEASYSTRTRHYITGNGFTWDVYDEVSR